jgi:hypothetical protein
MTAPETLHRQERRLQAIPQTAVQAALHGMPPLCGAGAVVCLWMCGLKTRYAAQLHAKRSWLLCNTFCGQGKKKKQGCGA